MKLPSGRHPSCSGIKQFLHFPCKKPMRCWFIQFVLYYYTCLWSNVDEWWWPFKAWHVVMFPAWTGSSFRLCCSKVLYGQIKKHLQPTIRPLLESMVPILRHLTHDSCRIAETICCNFIANFGWNSYNQFRVVGYLGSFQGCWQFQYIWSSYTHLMVTTRGMGYFIPYKYEVVPRKQKNVLHVSIFSSRFKISGVQPQEGFTPMLPQSASKAKSLKAYSIRLSDLPTHLLGIQPVHAWTRHEGPAEQGYGKDQQFTIGASKSLQHLGKIGRIWQVSLQKVVVSTINACSLCEWAEKKTSETSGKTWK